jgi:voltage-gated potassium channel
MVAAVSHTVPSPEDARPRRKRVGHVEDRFRGRAARAIATRRVFRYLASALAVTSIGAGVLVRAVDPKDFHSLGDGVWWALVTLATVGYGDIVPHTTWGRVIGSAVIVLGVTFLSLLTATVTSYFVSADQEDRSAHAEALRGADEETAQALLHEVLDRLDAIERTLEEREP